MITARHVAVITLAFTIFVVPALPAHAESSQLRGFRAAMIRRGGAINFTQAARESRRRLSFLTARSSSSQHMTISNNSTVTVPLRLDGGGGAYDMELAIGTPPQKLTALADTGSDLIWTRCGTASSPLYSYYDPTTSSTFAKLPCSDRLCGALRFRSRVSCAAAGAECDYRYFYGLGGAGDRHPYTDGFLASETFTLGGGSGDAAPGVSFGCATAASDGRGDFGEGTAGLVGLGRGPLSLVSQLDAGAFMYCLTGDAAKRSPLLLGAPANLTAAAGGADGVQSTGLLASVATYYAVDLRGITIGAETTPGVGAAGGGVVFDSGTTLTYLADPAYSAAKAAFLSQTVAAGMTQVLGVGERDGFEACFEKPAGAGAGVVGVPAMVLHFAGGADMDLPAANYLVEVYDGVVCWVVQRSPGTSVIGNIMQRDYLVLHDLRGSLLSFKPADCESYHINGNVVSASPRPLYQFSITVLLCVYIYNMYTNVF